MSPAAAFLGSPLYNPVLVDWSQVAAGGYFLNPLLLTPDVGRDVARQLDRWHSHGSLAIQSVYLVGHSLGGQCAAFTGKHLTQARAPRITGQSHSHCGSPLQGQGPRGSNA